MDFEDLELEDVKEPEKKKILITKELKLIEPGHKIPVADYLQVACWCEICDDVKTHAYSEATKKIRCLHCKTTKQK